jgi:Replication initiator protein, pSAM2
MLRPVCRRHLVAGHRWGVRWTPRDARHGGVASGGVCHRDRPVVRRGAWCARGRLGCCRGAATHRVLLAMAMTAGLLASLLAVLGSWGISGVRMGNRCGASRFTINATMVVLWWASRCVGGVMTTPGMCCSPGGRRSCGGALRIAVRRGLRGELRRRGEHPDGVAVSFVKVVELQARGIPHYHAVIGLDAAPDRDEPVARCRPRSAPPSWRCVHGLRPSG